MKFYVIRHGQTGMNVAHIYCGITDAELNALGRAQAWPVACRMAYKNIGLIITSPLRRCIYMAELIKDRTGAPIVVMKNFVERNWGVYEGLTTDQVKAQYLHLYEANITRQYDNAPPNGETIRQVEMRVKEGLALIKAKYPDRNVAITTHGYVGRVIHGMFNNISVGDPAYHAYTMQNAQIDEYKF